MKRVTPERRPVRATAGDWEALDHILAAEEELIPSCGFVSAVMERVREEAAAPRPLGFPWKRVLAPAALAASLLGWGFVELVRSLPAIGRGFGFSPGASAAALQGLMPDAWIALAVAAPILAWSIARRVAGGSGLL